jgi:hypothetical protein
LTYLDDIIVYSSNMIIPMSLIGWCLMPSLKEKVTGGFEFVGLHSDPTTTLGSLPMACRKIWSPSTSGENKLSRGR